MLGVYRFKYLIYTLFGVGSLHFYLVDDTAVPVVDELLGGFY